MDSPQRRATACSAFSATRTTFVVCSWMCALRLWFWPYFAIWHGDRFVGYFGENLGGVCLGCGWEGWCRGGSGIAGSSCP